MFAILNMAQEKLSKQAQHFSGQHQVGHDT